MPDFKKCLALFDELYGVGEKPRLFFAPGRGNLIGEHIDYNGGFVFPASLELGNYVYIRENGSEIVRLAAEDLPGVMVSCPLSELDSKRGKAWGSYQLGVCRELLAAGHRLAGCDMLFFSTLPFGAGLSSSASIEVATGFAMLGLLGIKPDRTEIALLCQRAENNFVGVNCGIMDQFACASGIEGMGMLLDCANVTCRQIPLNLGEFAIVTANTNKKRELADSKYNERRAECSEALAALRKARPDLPSLCALGESEFESLSTLIEDGTVKRRARHAVSENARVLRAAEFLQAGDINGFGRLLNESHRSLKELYEVTGFELDTMAELSQKAPGCVGCRMTGAGFGGCTVGLVKTGEIEAFVAEVDRKYLKATGLKPEFYVSRAGRGACEITGEFEE